MNRFFILSYVFNTIVIKAKALALKLTRGPYPYYYFKDHVNNSTFSEYTLNYVENYHSLSYLNYQKSKALHSGDRSITQDLIVGLAYYNDLIRNKDLDKKILIDLATQLKEMADYTENEMTFYFDKPYSRFDLNGRYSSGIVQGKAASYFLRCYKLTKEDRFKNWAKKCLLSAWKPVEDGGALRKLSGNHFWIEEYTSPKPSMVLNGYLFYIIGLAEYLAIEDDPDLKPKFEASLNTALAWIPNYRLKKGLLYSMYRWNLCNVHYTGIMKYQFDHLFKLTGILIFSDYANFCDELTDWDTFHKIV